jgi:hypothetical protein
MTKYFGDRRATQKECNEKIGEDGITRAQKMGNEYEEATLDCLRNESPLLKRLAEHGHALSIEPTYRRNPSTGNVEHVPDKMVETLLRNRQHEQLLGSIKPDIVVHPAGFPNRIQAVYDFKFSCMGYRGAWRRYTKGPHQKRSQGEVYEEFLGIKPKIIDPPNGTIP